MTETAMHSAIKPFVRRFAGTAVAVWLLYLGLWLVLFAIEQPVMSFLTWTVGGFVERFLVGSVVDKTSWSIRLFEQNMAEGAALILLGFLVGLWVNTRSQRRHMPD